MYKLSVQQWYISGSEFLIIYHVTNLPVSGENVLRRVFGAISLGSFHCQKEETGEKTEIIKYSSVIFYYGPCLKNFYMMAT